MKRNFQFSIFNFQFCRDGFTLLELVVAMTIIAILSTAIWGSFYSSLSKGRDARRKQDLDAIAKALEIYYNDNKAYPTSLPDPGTSFYNTDNTLVIYMQKIPADPAYPASTYCYPTVADGSYYQLYARIENLNDPKILASPVTCGSFSDYNYGISSPNVTP